MADEIWWNLPSRYVSDQYNYSTPFATSQEDSCITEGGANQIDRTVFTQEICSDMGKRSASFANTVVMSHLSLSIFKDEDFVVRQEAMSQEEEAREVPLLNGTSLRTEECLQSREFENLTCDSCFRRECPSLKMNMRHVEELPRTRRVGRLSSSRARAAQETYSLCESCFLFYENDKGITFHSVRNYDLFLKCRLLTNLQCRVGKHLWHVASTVS
jgi:hypothetical protein